MPTIKDVAKASGVSTATVSYVLNGKRDLPEATREHVLRFVRKLDYHPNAMARGLNQKRLQTLGMIFGIVDSVFVVNDPYLSAILQGALQGAAEAGYNVTIFTTPWLSASESARKHLDGRTDGILTIAPLLGTDIVSGLAGVGMPQVAVSFDGVAHGVPSVDVDNINGVQQAVRYLFELGHRRIAQLAGPHDLYSSILRAAAFREAMGGLGILVPEEYEQRTSYDGKCAFEQATQMLNLASPPTAIFAANDLIAISVLRAARHKGIRVPEDLSVIGFDDIAASSLIHPGLTTLRQPAEGIGTTAARILIKRLAGEEVKTEMVLLEPTLVVRETTAPPSI